MTKLMQVRKEASVLRDDIKTLINNLIRLYEKKLADFKVFFDNEIKKKYLLQAGNIDTLMDLLSHDADFMADIDGLDFEITACYEKLAATIGVSLANITKTLEDINRTTKTPDEKKMLTSLFSVKNELMKITKIVYNERKQLVSELKQCAAELKISINEISDIQIFEFADL